MMYDFYFKQQNYSTDYFIQFIPISNVALICADYAFLNFCEYISNDDSYETENLIFKSTKFQNLWDIAFHSSICIQMRWWYFDQGQIVVTPKWEDGTFSFDLDNKEMSEAFILIEMNLNKNEIFRKLRKHFLAYNRHLLRTIAKEYIENREQRSTMILQSCDNSEIKTYSFYDFQNIKYNINQILQKINV